MARICQITTIHPAKDVRIFRKICGSLIAAGHEVTLLVGNGQSEVCNGVRIIGVPVPVGMKFNRFFNASRELYRKAIEQRADVYHFHDPEFLPYAKRLVKSGHKVIYDVHEDVPRQILAKAYIPKHLRHLISRVFEIYEDRVVRRMTHVFTATDHIRDRFRSLTPHVTSLRNFPRMSELESVPPPASRVPDRICYVGSITETRGIFPLLEAIADIPCTLQLAGWFWPDSLRERCMAMSGWRNVDYIGFVDRDKIRSTLASASVGMVTLMPTPSYIDALPVKMFEYMAMGVPVVASNFPVYSKVVEGADCGLCVDPANPAAIRAAILRILSNPLRATEMGQNGRRAVEAHYNWEREEQSLLAVYREMTGD